MRVVLVFAFFVDALALTVFANVVLLTGRVVDASSSEVQALVLLRRELVSVWRMRMRLVRMIIEFDRLY